MHKERGVVAEGDFQSSGDDHPLLLGQPGLANPDGEQAASARAPLPPIIVTVESAAIDPSGLLEVSGWVVALAPIVAVQVFVDEAPVGNAVHGLAREEVAQSHGAYPHSDRSAFHFSMNL